MPAVPSFVHNPELFWQTAADFYKNDAVSALCLQLQNEHHINVNFTLLILLLAKHQWQVDLPEYLHQRVLQYSDETTGVQREVRNGLKQNHPELYQKLRQQMLALELQFERQEQGFLLAQLNSMSQVAANAEQIVIDSLSQLELPESVIAKAVKLIHL